jgi:pimeloyl-ACP methyl ester carboxylesterase
MTSKPTLPMALFNFGFDVWLADYRGHVFNQKHTGDTETTSMFADEPDTYWNFSKQQFATKDLPAQINAINEVTSEEVSLVGYSLGGATIMQFLGLAEVAGNDDLAAEYAKLNRVSLIAPCTNPISRFFGTPE